MRVCVFVSGFGSNLQALIDSKLLKSNGIFVVLVVSNNPEAFALERAKLAGIECVVMKYNRKSHEDEALIDWMEKRKIDVIVLAGFMKVLSEKFVDRFESRIVNVHPSLLPKHRGLNAIEQAFNGQDTNFGATVHLVDRGLDSGPILLQKGFQNQGQTLDQVKEQVHEVEHEILPKALVLLKDRLEEENQ